MMGWIFVIGFAIMTFGGLYLSGRLHRTALEIAVVALLIGMAGYAWQGSPDLAGHPVTTSAL